MSITEWTKKILAEELAGEKLERYDGAFGDWIWKHKLKWNKLPVEEKEKLLTLSSFQPLRNGMFDVTVAEWDRMFKECQLFEAAHPGMSICHKQKSGNNPLGRWLTNMRSDCVMKKKIKTAGPTFWKKLQTLGTIQRWEKEREISRDEQFQRTLDKTQEDIKNYLRHQARATPKVLSHYAILQVSENASPEVVRAAYRALSVIHHPDKGGNVEMYKKIQHAYDALMK